MLEKVVPGSSCSNFLFCAPNHLSIEALYQPRFGGAYSIIIGSTSNTHKFTGKERDAESNLDNFGARYDSSSLGRFMSPDPLLSSGRLGNPQTWNRYAYA